MPTPIVTIGTNRSTASGYIAGLTQTSAADLTYTTTNAFYLESVMMHSSAVSSGTNDYFKVILDSADGSDYDTTMLQTDMELLEETDLVYQPDLPFLCKGNDTIQVTYANTTSGGVYWAIRIITRAT